MPQFQVRYALRGFRQNPLLVAIAVGSLSLGIGANTAIFSLIDQLLWRPLPVVRPHELVGLAARGPHYGSNWGMDAMSYPMYMEFRDKTKSFQGVLCRARREASIGFAGQTERVEAELVSGNYFQVLGVPAAIGRSFTGEDDQKADAHPVVMLSYDYWKSRFAGDPEIVGKALLLNNQPMTIVGVSARGFQGVELGDATQVFAPMMMLNTVSPTQGSDYTLGNRRGRWTNVFARLKPGVSMEQARAEATTLYKQIIAEEVKLQGFRRASDYTRQQFLTSRLEMFPGGTGRSYLRRQFTTPLYVLLGLTGVVLLIACANVANLLIARATARRKEMSIRVALGASKSQIVTQLLTESLLLSGVSAVLGLLVGTWTVKFLLSFVVDPDSTITFSDGIDPRMAGFALVLAVVTSVLFGLAPAVQAAAVGVAETLKNEAGGVLGGGAARFRKGLVVGQVSLSVLLLIASGLFVRSLMNLKTLDPGFRVERLVTFSLNPGLAGYDEKRTAPFMERLVSDLGGMPGVESVSYGAMALLSGNEWDSTITVEGYESKQGENMNPYFNAVYPNYFVTVGIPFVAGRDFTKLETLQEKAQVCIVNESFVKRYFADGRAIGKRIGRGGDPGTKLNMEIIGVVKDAKYDTLRDETPRQVFIPYAGAFGSSVYVRATQDPASVFNGIRMTLRNLDANVPAVGMRTLEDQLDRSLMKERLIASLSAAFGLLATILAVVGLYGVMTFSVARRSREIGIRLALGASGGSVVGMVMREVGLLVGIGVAIAVPLYVVLSKAVHSQLYGVSATDVGTSVGAVILLTVVALVAGYVPARRAARLDPVRVLRYE